MQASDSYLNYLVSQLRHDSVRNGLRPCPRGADPLGNQDELAGGPAGGQVFVRAGGVG